MKKTKKAFPVSWRESQSWDSAVQWLSTFAEKRPEERPLLHYILVRDGKGYATDGFALAVTDCPLPLEDCLIAVGPESVTASPADYVDVQHIIEDKQFGESFSIPTEDLVTALKRVKTVNGGADYRGALLVYNRDDRIAYLYAENNRGAAVSIMLTATPRHEIGEVYGNRLSGGWITPELWLKALKGWTKGKHGWPDVKGCDKTLIKLSLTKRDDWYSQVARLSPDTPLHPQPFVVIMNAVINYGIKLASEAYAKAQSGDTEHQYVPDKMPKLRHRYVRKLPLSDLPMFQGVGAFELGKGKSIQEWKEAAATELIDQYDRLGHYIKMRNHPAMRLYNHPEAVAHGEHIGPFIEAIKASQRP